MILAALAHSIIHVYERESVKLRIDASTQKTFLEAIVISLVSQVNDSINF